VPALVERPVGIAVTLAVMVVVFIAEPVLAWFIFSALVIGVVVAVILPSSKPSPARQPDEKMSEIQLAKIPVKRAMGLVFTTGTMAIFFISIPQACWFRVLALPAGVLIGAGLYLSGAQTAPLALQFLEKSCSACVKSEHLPVT